VRLVVRGFGPIGEADVLLRRFTLFVGPNAAGKSYFAYLIWVLLNVEPDWNRLRDVINRFVNPLPSGVESLAEAVKEAVMELLREFPNLFGDSLRRGLQETYMVDSVGYLVNVGSDVAEVGVLSDDGGNRIVMEVSRSGELRLSAPEGPGVRSVPGVFEVSASRVAEDVVELVSRLGGREIYRISVNVHEPGEVGGAVAAMFATLLHSLFDGYLPLTNSALLPDGRAGILRTRAPLIYVLLRERTLSPSFLVSSVDAEFLALMESLPRRGERDPAMSEVAELLESELGARFEVDVASVERLFIRYGGVSMPLMRTASGFRELAPLAYLLKYGHDVQVLIVEEPEAHLHPDAQSLVTRVLAAAASHANRTVIVTTHSIHVLDEVNHLIRLSRLGVDERVRLGYRPWEGLESNGHA